MTVIHMLRFYRSRFGDTRYKDMPMVGSTLEEAKQEACEALNARFRDNRAAGRLRQAPYSAVLLDDLDHVIARFEYRPGTHDRPEGAYELPPEIWHDKMAGTPSSRIVESLDARSQ
ncbi:hypothetical protein [Rhizobium leguminosarum]|uniref:hypothetical protein n=1 Tax=Rhizobium leguminosarum TaxID=384 RepID=UPI003F9727DD